MSLSFKMTLNKMRSRKYHSNRQSKTLFRFVQFVVHLFVIIEFTKENEAAVVKVRVPLGIIITQDNEEIKSAFETVVGEVIKFNTAKVEFGMSVDIINTVDAFKLSRVSCKQFSHGVVVMGYVLPDALSTLHSYANTYEIPFITPWFRQNDGKPTNHGDYALSFVPDYHQAVLDIIDYFEWKSVYYIYNSHSGLLRLQQIYQSIEISSKHSFRIAHVKKVVTAAEAVEFLATIELQDRWSNKVVILDAPGPLCRDILAYHVRDVRLGRRNYHYFLTRIVMDENWSNRDLGAIRVTGFKLIDNSRQVFKNFRTIWPKRYITASAAVLRDIVMFTGTVLNNWYFKQPEHIKAIANIIATHNFSKYECNSPSAINFFDPGDQRSVTLKKGVFEGITGHIAFDNNGTRKNFTLQIVEFNNNKRLKRIGRWYDYKGLEMLIPPKPKLSPGMYDRNKTYIVVTVEEPPYVMSNTKVPEMLVPFNYRGFCVDLTEKLCDMLEIKCQMRLSYDGLYGLKNPGKKGGWDGAVGELIRGEADMAIASIMVTLERQMAIDFSKPFLTIDKKTRRSYNFLADAFGFFTPFAQTIWYCIAIAILIVSSVLWLVSKFSPLEWRVSEHNRAVIVGADEQVPRARVVNEFTFLNCIWYAFSSILQQGNGLSPRSMSGRVVSVTWLTFAWFSVAMYTASLGASLILTEINYPTFEHIRTARCPRDTPYGTGPLIPLQLLERQGWIFYVWEIPDGGMNGNCEVLINLYRQGLQEYAAAFPRGSRLRDGVNIALEILQNNGEIADLITKWFVRDECGNVQRFPYASELTMYHLSGLFYILIGGLLVAMLVSICEFVLVGRFEYQRGNLTLRAVLMARPRLQQGAPTPSLQMVTNDSDPGQFEWDGEGFTGYYSPSSHVQEETVLEESFTTV